MFTQQREEARRIETEQTYRLHIGGIVVGDRVKITKRVRNLNGRNITNAERLATVTRTEKNKIYFTTDNGAETWRLPNNLDNSS